MSIRVRETYGTSWRGTQPGTRHWRSTSVSYGLGTGLLGFGVWSLFILPFILLWWLLLAEVWVCAEMLLLAVTVIIAVIALARREIGFADLMVTPLRYHLFAIGLKGGRQ